MQLASTVITQAAWDARIVPYAQRILAGGPTRIMVDEVSARSPNTCSWTQINSITVIFIRDDGWSLGASQELFEFAQRTWQDQWRGVIYTTKKRTYVTSYEEWIKEDRPVGLSPIARKQLAALTKEQKQDLYNLKRNKGDWKTTR